MKDKIRVIIIFLSIISLNLLLLKIYDFPNKIDSNYKIVNKNINQEIYSINKIETSSYKLNLNIDLICRNNKANLFVNEKENNLSLINNYNSTIDSENEDIPWLYIVISATGILLVIFLIILVVIKKRKKSNSNKTELDKTLIDSKDSNTDEDMLDI